MSVLNKEQSWSEFVLWCEGLGLCPAPCHPWTLAVYVRSLEGKVRLDVIRRRIGQIGQMHFEKLRKRPDRDPLVKRTLESVRKRADKPKKAPKSPPLFRAEDFIEDPPAKAKKKPAKKKAAEKPPGKPRRTLSGTPKLVRRKRV